MNVFVGICGMILSIMMMIPLFMFRSDIITIEDIELSREINQQRIKERSRPLPCDIYGRVPESILKMYRK